MYNTFCVLSAYVQSNVLYIAVLLLGTENKERVTGGLFMFNALADIVSSAAAGSYISSNIGTRA